MAADGLESAAARWPAKEAIVFDDVSYTFADWNAKANQVRALASARTDRVPRWRGGPRAPG